MYLLLLRRDSNKKERKGRGGETKTMDNGARNADASRAQVCFFFRFRKILLIVIIYYIDYSYATHDNGDAAPTPSLLPLLAPGSRCVYDTSRAPFFFLLFSNFSNDYI